MKSFTAYRLPNWPWRDYRIEKTVNVPKNAIIIKTMDAHGDGHFKNQFEKEFPNLSYHWMF